MESPDLLPRNHSITMSPDFRPRLLAAVRARRRRRAANRIAVVVMTGACAIGLTWAAVPRVSDPVRYEIPVAKAKPRPVAPAPAVVPISVPKVAKARPHRRVAHAPHAVAVAAKPPESGVNAILGQRLEAIRALTPLPGPSATADLITMYRRQTEPEIRRAVIAALFTRRDAHSLESLARNETDPALRAELKTRAMQIPKNAPEYLPARNDPNNPNP